MPAAESFNNFEHVIENFATTTDVMAVYAINFIFMHIVWHNIASD
jgi:hypothetical protein